MSATPVLRKKKVSSTVKCIGAVKPATKIDNASKPPPSSTDAECWACRSTDKRTKKCTICRTSGFPIILASDPINHLFAKNKWGGPSPVFLAKAEDAANVFAAIPDEMEALKGITRIGQAKYSLEDARKNEPLVLVDANEEKDTPAIVLVPATESVPTMDLKTWKVLGKHPYEGYAVNIITTQRMKKKAKHSAVLCKCIKCYTARWADCSARLAWGGVAGEKVNPVEMAEIEGNVETEGTKARSEVGTEKKADDKSRKSRRDSAAGEYDGKKELKAWWEPVPREMEEKELGLSTKALRVSIFSVDWSDPKEPALFLPREKRLSAKRGVSGLRTMYVAQGGIDVDSRPNTESGDDGKRSAVEAESAEKMTCIIRETLALL
ncbi:hypothetical protein P280DRAFT_524122 [Massarina eburnea CBS 473.64]|uniref:Uncharacterized protein n=1 Tax=Massarina eburnea CBS 473.64 TaxID=1395130 RepID=A0A6A6RG47_9PLEO|nr:hypothetical protein P280DRAFT_524122 [Massarina eburnea CBS 473.64]